MADTTKLYKMNVRSPYFVVATEEGKPDSIAADFVQDDDTPDDDENLPDEPDDFVIPSIDGQDVYCGDTVNVSSDIGRRTYRLVDSEGKTGDFTVTYRVNVPIKLTASDGDSSNLFFFQYLGDSAYKDALNKVGGDESVYTELVAGEATGTRTFNKDVAEGTMSWRVTSPLETDDYSLTFSCPSSDTIPASSRTLPSQPVTGEIVMNVLAFWYRANYNIDSAGNDTRNANVSLVINGTTAVQSMNYDEIYIISDQSQLGDTTWYNDWKRTTSSKTTNYISRGTNLKVGANDVRIRTDRDAYGVVSFARLGLFWDGSAWKYTNVGDEKSYSFAAAPMGQNSFLHFQGFGFGRITSGVHTHVDHRLDWFEPSDGTHAYISNQVAEFPWWHSDAYNISARSMTYSKYNTTISGGSVTKETIRLTSAGYNYHFPNAVTGDGTTIAYNLGQFSTTSN